MFLEILCLLAVERSGGFSPNEASLKTNIYFHRISPAVLNWGWKQEPVIVVRKWIPTRSPLCLILVTHRDTKLPPTPPPLQNSLFGGYSPGLKPCPLGPNIYQEPQGYTGQRNKLKWLVQSFFLAGSWPGPKGKMAQLLPTSRLVQRSGCQIIFSKENSLLVVISLWVCEISPWGKLSNMELISLICGICSGGIW